LGETLERFSFEAALESRLLRARGWIELMSGERGAARETLGRALALAGDDPSGAATAESYLGVLAEKSERFSDALASYQRALDALNRLDENGSRRAHDWYLRGQAFQIMEQYEQAIDCYDKASSLDAENIHTWLALGWCHKRSGRLDLAIQALEEALDVDSSEAIVHYNLACYWSLANNVKLAVAYLSSAFDIDSNFRDLVSDETDFDAIRDDPSFQAVLTVNV
ncbi:MAG: tetratricopeptide repeat protein, partial [Pirellulaceae bacterium]|nr:tetratricopeptide repeat protein [Pirellulaceae bacterium]